MSLLYNNTRSYRKKKKKKEKEAKKMLEQISSADTEHTTDKAGRNVDKRTKAELAFQKVKEKRVSLQWIFISNTGEK